MRVGRRLRRLKLRRKKDPPRREFQTILHGLDFVTANDDPSQASVVRRENRKSRASQDCHDLHVREKCRTPRFRRNLKCPREDFSCVAVEARRTLDWMLLIYYAFRKYKLVHRLYPPLLGDQTMLPLA